MSPVGGGGISASRLHEIGAGLPGAALYGEGVYFTDTAAAGGNATYRATSGAWIPIGSSTSSYITEVDSTNMPVNLTVASGVLSATVKTSAVFESARVGLGGGPDGVALLRAYRASGSGVLARFEAENAQTLVAMKSKVAQQNVVAYEDEASGTAKYLLGKQGGADGYFMLYDPRNSIYALQYRPDSVTSATTPGDGLARHTQQVTLNHNSPLGTVSIGAGAPDITSVLSTGEPGGGHNLSFLSLFKRYSAVGPLSQYDHDANPGTPNIDSEWPYVEYHGIGSTLYYGINGGTRVDDTRGLAHTIDSFVNIYRSGWKNNEWTTFRGGITFPDDWTSVPGVDGDMGHVWLQDLSVVGPKGKQVGMLSGPVIAIKNRSATPTVANATTGLVVQSEPTIGDSTGNSSYPMDYGIQITGRTSLTDVGFRTALKIGGHAAWADSSTLTAATMRIRLGLGIEITQAEAGVKVHRRYISPAGTPSTGPAFQCGYDAAGVESQSRNDGYWMGDDTMMWRAATGVAGVANALLVDGTLGSGYIELREQTTAPGAPGTGRARIYLSTTGLVAKVGTSETALPLT